MGWGEPHRPKGSAHAERIDPVRVAPHPPTEIPQAAIGVPVRFIADDIAWYHGYVSEFGGAERETVIIDDPPAPAFTRRPWWQRHRRQLIRRWWRDRR